jgi:hypothetical protein
MFYLGYKYGMNKVLSNFNQTKDILSSIAEKLEEIEEIEEHEEKEEKKIHQMLIDIDKKSKQLQKDKKT